MRVMKYQVGPMSIFSHIRWGKKPAQRYTFRLLKATFAFVKVTLAS